MEASYKKLRDGSWGIRTQGGVPDVGDDVEVTTKSGEVKQETVTKIVWSGKNDQDDDAAICEIQQRDRNGNPVDKPKQQGQQQQGGQRQVGQQKQSTSKCKCFACGTTDPEKEYYCGDCVLTGNARKANVNAQGGDGGGGNGGGEGDDDEIPF